MTLSTSLGYRVDSANAIQRGFQALGATSAGAWLFSRLLPLVDPLVFRLSKGRLTLPSILAGFPVVMVTTTGARTGRLRTSPLLAISFGDELAVIGTNFGQARTPGWVHNLEADPQGSIAYRDRTVDFVAREATPEEVDLVIDAGAEVYPGYAAYRTRVTDREIRVFLLSEA